jgi:hypothetical protein
LFAASARVETRSSALGRAPVGRSGTRSGSISRSAALSFRSRAHWTSASSTARAVSRSGPSASAARSASSAPPTSAAKASIPASASRSAAAGSCRSFARCAPRERAGGLGALSGGAGEPGAQLEKVVRLRPEACGVAKGGERGGRVAAIGEEPRARAERSAGLLGRGARVSGEAREQRGPRGGRDVGGARRRGDGPERRGAHGATLERVEGELRSARRFPVGEQVRELEPDPRRLHVRGEGEPPLEDALELVRRAGGAVQGGELREGCVVVGDRLAVRREVAARGARVARGRGGTASEGEHDGALVVREGVACERRLRIRERARAPRRRGGLHDARAPGRSADPSRSPGRARRNPRPRRGP